MAKTKTLGERLKEFRYRKGWSQLQLAVFAGISRRSLQRAENGEPAVGPKALYKLRKAIGEEAAA